jgi:hypothetical protein
MNEEAHTTRYRELRARVARGDTPSEIGQWFLQALIDTNAKWGDLTPYELAWFQEMMRAFNAWLAEQIHH